MFLNTSNTISKKFSKGFFKKLKRAERTLFLHVWKNVNSIVSKNPSFPIISEIFFLQDMWKNHNIVPNKFCLKNLHFYIY